MANQFDERTTTQGFDPATSASVPRAKRDEGLRKYMLGVYNYMASGILLTGIVSLLAAQAGFVGLLYDPATGAPTMLAWAMMFGPFALVMWLQFRIFKMSVQAAQATYWIYAALVGASISTIFMTFTPVSIAQTFFTTAIAFGGLSFWGYTTKKDLSGWGTFLIMGIWGLFAAMLLNVLVFKSATADLAMSAIGLLIFAAFTAYKTQEVKSIYFQVRGNAEMMAKTTIYGALHLYMAFINMFLFLLRFMGSRE